MAGDPNAKVLPMAPPPRSPALHPTQVYSAINALLIALFLLAFYAHRRRDGEVFALGLTIYPVTRFLLEIIRTDEPARFGSVFTISQLVSIVILLAAVVVWVIVTRQPRTAPRGGA